jgi:hypothetical protein
MKHPGWKWHNVMVARSVGQAEVRREPEAQAALNKEWEKLEKAGCWDLSSVQEWHGVAQAAQKSGTKVHVGRVAALCTEKNSELPRGSAGRMYKGRVVFLGNNVADEQNMAAIFADLGSAPCTMAAGKMIDLVGLFPGYKLTQADAMQAYIQSRLRGTPTYIWLPKER